MTPKDGTAVVAKAPKSPIAPLEAMTAEPGEISEAAGRSRTPGTIAPSSQTSGALAERESDPAEETEDHWIALELKDQDGNPVPDEPYRIKLPDGAIRSGYTDPEGKARVEGIPAGGQAEINFPRIHGDEWKPA